MKNLSLSNPVKLLLAILILIIVFLLSLLFYIKSTYTQKAISVKSQAQSTISKNKGFLAPISFQDPTVVGASINYRFDAVITNVKTTKGIMNISTNIPALPSSLNLANDTEIYLSTRNLKDSKENIASSSALQAGQHVQLNIKYDVRKGSWTLRTIKIKTATESSSPSPTSQRF